MVNLTVSLTKELAGTGLTVNTISPGTILTHWVERGAANSGARLVRTGRNLKSGQCKRFGLIQWKLVATAWFINGANLRVDGGNIASIN